MTDSWQKMTHGDEKINITLASVWLIQSGSQLLVGLA